MHRLFVAIRPPLEVRARLLTLTSGVPAARWQTDAQLHLTLCFIGEVDTLQADDIAAALRGIRGSAIEIEIEGVGSFGPEGRPNSLWAGVKLSEPLDRLRQAVERRLVGTGVTPDRRAFRPHITLARLPRSAGPIDRWLVDHAGLHLPSFTAQSFGLFESRLGSGGAAYGEVVRYPLR